MTMRTETSSGAGTDPGNKSSAELEREVRQQRADVERTLDAIQDRLSPGQLVDEAMNYLREGSGGEFFRNLGTSVKQNPVPIALIGVGVAWMMASSARGNGERRRDDWVDDDADDWDELDTLEDYETGAYAGTDYPYGASTGTTGSGFGEAGSATAFDPEIGSSATVEDDDRPGMTDRAKAAAADARRRADELRHRARDAVGGAKASAGAMADSARERMGRAGRDFSDRAHRAGESAQRYTRSARRGVVHTIDEHPLLLGAIGLVVGAALGSVLPASEREDRLMGSSRDRLKRRAVATGREQVDRAQAAAGAAYEAAREEADRQGLTPEGGKEALHAAREKLERVAEAATTAGKEAAERKTPGSTGSTGSAGSPGSAGSTGSTGSTSSTGSPGSTRSPGSTGSTGSTGSPGLTGSTGSPRSTTG